MDGSALRTSPWWLRTGRVTALAVVLAFLNAGCSALTGDEDPNPPAELTDFKPTLRLKKVWTADLGEATEALRLALQPSSDGARIFAAAHDGRVSAFDAVKGKRLWIRKTDLPLSGGPATDGEVVVVGSSDGEVVALNAADGQQRWRTTVSSEVLAAPAIAGGYALVRSVDGKLAALDLIDGRQVWFVQQAMPRLTLRGTGAPVVIKDLVIAGFDNGKLASYSLLDGSPGWDVLLDPPSGRNEVERMSDINATVRTVGEDVYVVSYRGQLNAVAAESGQSLWSQETRSYDGLAVDLENVYVSTDSSELQAFSRQSGSELWKSDVLKNRDISGPTAYQSSVVVGDFDGYVHFFDNVTGKLQARATVGSDRVTSPPLVVNDMLYVQTDGGDLAAFRQVDK